LNILSQFHCNRDIPISTVETLVEALDRLLEQNVACERRGVAEVDAWKRC
jgi:hypothetical protein